jgi:biopolymer transport protein ExbD
VRFKHHSAPPDVSFDLTPMIDVVLLLIIFFMFTTHFTRMQLLPMDLPRQPGEDAAASATGAGPDSLVIDIDRDGTLRMGGQSVKTAGPSVEETTTAIRKALAQAAMPEKQSAATQDAPDGRVETTPASMAELDVVVRADRACPARAVNLVVKELGRVGVKRWKLATAGPEVVGRRPPVAAGEGGS